MNIQYIKIGQTGKFIKLQFENKNIMIGSLFSEADLISIKNIINSDNESLLCKETANKNKNSAQSNEKKLSDFIQEIILDDYLESFFDVNVVIFTHLDEILSWPFLLRKINQKKLQLNNYSINNESNFLTTADSIKDSYKALHSNSTNKILKDIIFLTTEPINQISRILLNDFYNFFNKLMIENIPDYPYFVNAIFLNEFSEQLINLNYNCEFKLEDFLKIILASSGYNLGSSNVLFKFYNKKIIYLSKSSFYAYRYPKPFELFESFAWDQGGNSNSNKKISSTSPLNKPTEKAAALEPDVLICAEDLINFENDFIPQFEKIINNINVIMQQYDRENNHFPKIFFPTDPLFMLDFIDILRLKISSEIKCIYVSNVIKPILEYSNISHGFLNKDYHDKIYEFKLPFLYEELIKNSKSIFIFIKIITYVDI